MNNDLSAEIDQNLANPETVSADLSTELEESAASGDIVPESVSKIDKLRAENPPVAKMKAELESFANRKLSASESKLTKLELDVISNLPEFVDVMSEIRDMNKLKYRLSVNTYDEIKSLWLKFIHDIL